MEKIDQKAENIRLGKGCKDRIVPISDKILQVLKVYRKTYPSMNLVFKSFSSMQQRLGHKSVAMTMLYLHVAKLETGKCIHLIDTIFPSE